MKQLKINSIATALNCAVNATTIGTSSWKAYAKRIKMWILCALTISILHAYACTVLEVFIPSFNVEHVVAKDCLTVQYVGELNNIEKGRLGGGGGGGGKEYIGRLCQNV